MVKYLVVGVLLFITCIECIPIKLTKLVNATRKAPKPSKLSFFTISRNVTSVPSAPADYSIPPSERLNKMMSFLQKFGYLQEGDLNSEALVSQESVSQAISTMQRFGGINPTGKIDNATLKLLVTPRCGNKDSDAQSQRKKRFVVGAPGWTKRRLTYFLANWTPKLGSEQATVKELEKAFKVWSDYGHLKFVRVGSPDADIVVLFGNGYHGDRYPFDGPGFTLAHAYYPYEMGASGGDVHFDEDESWVIGTQDNEVAGVDFFTVATHEIGHSLGLSHSPVAGSIMFPYYKGSQPNLQLDYDDILAMHQLYISRVIEDDRDIDQVDVTTSPTSTTDATSMTVDATSSTTDATSLTVDATPSTTDATSLTVDATPSTTDATSLTVDATASTTDATYLTVDATASTTDATSLTVDAASSTTDVTYLATDGSSSTPPSRNPSTTVSSTTFSAISATTSSTTRGGAREESERQTGEKNVGVTPVTESTDIIGEYDVVDEQLRRLDLNTNYQPDELPDICQGNFDAVSALRNELFVFKNKYVWRFRQRSMLDYGYPTFIRNLFRELPSTLRNIDALYERPNGNIVFFSGSRYWVFDGDYMVDENLPLTYLGLPEGLAKIDAALLWGKNGKTYLFSGDVYWRYDDTKQKMDAGYPLPMTRWRGVPTHLDGAMRWIDGKTYFFKDQSFWGFNDKIVKTESKYPLAAPSHWLGCWAPEK